MPLTGVINYVFAFIFANIIEKTLVYHTVNGNCALFHKSKSAKMIKVIITKQHVDILTRFSK